MEHTLKDYTLTLIDEPLQSHVVAWEKAARSLKNDDAKPLLNKIMAALASVNVVDGNLSAVVMNTFKVITDALREAIRILDANETLTLSANHSVYVKAAIMSGWVVSPEMTVEDVDNMKPWLVTWIAERIGLLYLDATTIPKN